MIFELAFRKSPEWQEYEDILLAAATVPKTSLNSASQADAGIEVQQTKQLHWGNIEVAFLSDHRVQVEADGQPHTYNYAEMGFADQRNGNPTKAWGVLHQLAEQRGGIPHEARDSKHFIAREKIMERMRQTLRTHFQIASDPIERNASGRRTFVGI